MYDITKKKTNSVQKNEFHKFISKLRIISLVRISILRRIWLNFMAQYLVFSTLVQISHFLPDFQLFRPQYHWRDLISRNVHLVHQNWYRITFDHHIKFLFNGVIKHLLLAMISPSKNWKKALNYFIWIFFFFFFLVFFAGKKKNFFYL
jgi:hypothetical protein